MNSAPLFVSSANLLESALSSTARSAISNRDGSDAGSIAKMSAKRRNGIGASVNVLIVGWGELVIVLVVVLVLESCASFKVSKRLTCTTRVGFDPRGTSGR